MERMKLTKKEKEQILKGGVEAMTKIIERLEEENKKLTEENKKLKEENERLRFQADNIITTINAYNEARKNS